MVELATESLDSLAHRIRDAHALVGGCVRDAVLYAIEAGQLLLEARATVRHGEWLSWLKKNCAMSERTAQNYMRLSKKTSTLAENPQRVADLTMRGAVALLAKPKRIAADSDSDVKRRAVEKPNRLDDASGSHVDDETENGDIVGHHDAETLYEVSALRQALEKRLPGGCTFFLLAAGPIDRAAADLVDQLFALSERLGWIVRASDGARIIIGRVPLQSAARSTSEAEQAPHGGAGVHSPSQANERTLPITSI
jgi:hypothetical protein